jgi:hypothetical protein
VSRESAARDYGVVLESLMHGLTPTVVVDEEKTIRLRKRLAAGRAPLALIHRGEYAERLRREGRITFGEHIAPLHEVVDDD